MELVTRSVSEADGEAASALIELSFIELAATDWEPHARETLVADSSPVALREKIVSAYVVATFAGEQMVGFLLMPKPTRLQMLFVHPQWLRRGIGRALWENARTYVEANYAGTTTRDLPYSL